MTRHREVVVNVRRLKGIEARGQEKIAFDLFEDVQLVGEVRRRDRPGAALGYPDTFSISGTILGPEHGEFNLVVHQGVVAGVITIAGKTTYQLHALGGGVHEVCELDFAAHGGCGTTEAHQIAPAGPGADADPVSGAFLAKGLGEDDGTVLDMMILYTPGARLQWGGIINVEAEAMLSIEVSNTALANSLIDTRFNLVHLAEIQYSESGDGFTDLQRLTQTNNGFMDDIHALRTQVGADNVSLFGANLGPGLCGIAWVMASDSSIFESLSFNVCRIDCAAANRTYPHEVGHNLGCAHDQAAGGTGAFAFSHGYKEPGGVFRTILGTFSSTIPRVGHFSNPQVSFQNLPTGDPAADNARTIEITRVTMAQFRESVCPAQNSEFDCNLNCIDDAQDIFDGTELDCNQNLIPDSCEIGTPGVSDCNSDGIPDSCQPMDCNENGINDSCEPDNDCDLNGILDECEMVDCNGNGVLDVCELGSDCNNNDILDECEFTDCNSNGILDACELGNDCEGNGIPDECEWVDCDGNGVHDPCQTSLLCDCRPGFPDCNNNGVSDACESEEISAGFVASSPVYAPFGAALEPRSFVVSNPPLPIGIVSLTFHAIGPLFPGRNAVDITLNGNSLGKVFISGEDCPTTPDEEVVVLSADEFLGHTLGGEVIIGMNTWDYLEEHCNFQTSISVTLSYPATIQVNLDTNNNGVLDTCDLARGDSNLDTVVEILDFLAVLDNWGPCAAPCPSDANLDGEVGIDDFLNVLRNWG